MYDWIKSCVHEELGSALGSVFWRNIRIQREAYKRLYRKEYWRSMMEDPATRARYNESRRDRQFKKQTGISRDEADRMAEDRGNKCDICGRPPPGNGRNGKRLAVDHCHETGVIRGMLCNKCNVGIGMLGDSPGMLYSAASYLRRPRNGYGKS